MFDKINLLKVMGYYPDVILDIGSHHGNWTTAMKEIYNSCEYHLFEAINYPELNRFKTRSTIFQIPHSLVLNTNVHSVILNNKVEEVDWYEMRNTGDSFFKEKSKHFVNCQPTKRMTIDLQSYVENKRSFFSVFYKPVMIT